jgi:hypothetical protein
MEGKDSNPKLDRQFSSSPLLRSVIVEEKPLEVAKKESEAYPDSNVSKSYPVVVIPRNRLIISAVIFTVLLCFAVFSNPYVTKSYIGTPSANENGTTAQSDPSTTPSSFPSQCSSQTQNILNLTNSFPWPVLRTYSDFLKRN